MDFIRNRNFRQTLLVHRDAPINRKVQPTVLKEFFFTSSLRAPQAGTVDLKPEVDQAFPIGSSNAAVNAKDPFLKAVFGTLTTCAFRRISFNELLEGARQAAAPYVTEKDAARRAAVEEATVLQNLMQLYMRGVIDVYVERPNLVLTPPAQPAATALARFQALNSRQVTSRTHNSVNFDIVARYIVAACDGSRDRDGILAEMIGAAKADKFRVMEKDQRVEDDNRLRQTIGPRVDVVLSKLGEYGFFAA